MGSSKHSTTRGIGNYQAYVHHIHLELKENYYSIYSELLFPTPASLNETGNKQIWRNHGK